MLRKNRLFTPGPTPLLPAAQTAMASFTAHHRTADFRQLFQRVLADMKDFVGAHHFGFIVDDITETQKRVEAAGATEWVVINDIEHLQKLTR